MLFIIDKIFIRKKFNISDTIIVTGSPRTGTTWLMEILCSIPEYTTLFEPLHKEWFPKSIKAGFNPRTYMSSSENNQKMEEYLHNVFTGKITSSLPHYKLDINTITQRIRAEKLIVKFVRANRLLPWISTKFNLKSMILITRHPCATIASQLETGIRGYLLPKNLYPTKKIIINEVTNMGITEDIENKLININHREELLAVMWALDHYPISIFPEPHPWIKVKYENLLTNGEIEITNLLKFLGEEKHIEKAVKKLKIPSTTTQKHEKNEAIDINYQLSKWKQKLSKDEIKNIYKVLSWFNFNFNDNNYNI